MMKKNTRKRSIKKPVIKKPRFTGWISSDKDEINRRKFRAIEEKISITKVLADKGFFGDFTAQSISGQSYNIEIRSLAQNINSCSCPDFQINGLGTCKHIEATLLKIEKGRKRRFREIAKQGGLKIEIFLDKRDHAIKIFWPQNTTVKTKNKLGKYFSAKDTLKSTSASGLKKFIDFISGQSWLFKKKLNLSKQILPWLETLKQEKSKLEKRKAFKKKLEKNNGQIASLKYPLYAYQQEGMMHLAFTGRALLADEMGLGKTVQAIAACLVLQKTYAIKTVLVIAPASLKSEWEEQIAKFTDLSSQIVIGSRKKRLAKYAKPSFFNLLNYEQVRPDFSEINSILKPDVIILDEAQRIKNWQTKTAEAVKRLSSRFAFVLTGTPLENRIDEVYSIIQFLDPRIFGPLFRFNRDFYQLDESGRAIGYQNLDILNDRLKNIMLRRRKEQVEGELPGRSDKNYFVPMSKEQALRYNEYSEYVAQMAAKARRRPLTKEEMDKMQTWLACMRMLCDAVYILDQSIRTSPKIKELGRILDDIFSDGEHKVIIFSEWERMLVLVKDLLDAKQWSYAWHTGSVSQPNRRVQINNFKNDPECRFFLSTDSGSLGLNLQTANVVINLDLPWNPAKLEQRIARAWRKHQTQHVQVINLVCENSIEHKMLDLLAQKTLLADHVIDGKVEQTAMKLPSGRAAFLKRIDDLLNDPDATNSDQNPGQQTESTIDGHFDEPVELVEIHQIKDKKTAFVVSNNTAENSQEKIRKEIAKQVNVNSIDLEIINKETYEIIQRLIEAGILAPTSLTPTLLHKKSSVQSLNEDLRKQRLSKTKKQFGEAEHKHKMANLLVQGGFTKEAIVSLHESMKIALRALFYFSGNDNNDELTPARITSQLQGAKLAPQGTADFFQKLEGMNLDQEIDNSGELFKSSSDFFDFANELLIPQSVIKDPRNVTAQ